MNLGTIKTPHILLLEDDRAHQDLILRAFRDDPDPFRVTVAENLLKARQIIERDSPDLILADWILPDGKGLDILSRKDGSVTTPVVIMTSFGDEHLAVEIMKSGAIDYVVKSASMFADLPHITRKALRDWENIRERKRAEEAVQDTQKRLADILSFLPDAVFAIDNDGRIIAWNIAIEQMTGVAAEEMLGKGDHEYSLPFYGERRPILIDLVQTEDPGTEKKYFNVQRDGDRITSETFIPTLFGGRGGYLWGTATPLYDNAGNRTGAIEVIRDITERKQSEELLRQREATLETILNAPKDTIALLDLQGTILGINDEGAQRLGGTVMTVTGRCAYDLFPPDVARIRKEYVDRVFATGNILRSDDAWSGMYLHNEFFPIFNTERTAVDRVAIFARDTTDQKRAEQALQESETRFKDLFNNIGAGVAIYTATPDGKDFIIRDINRAVETIEHVRKDDIVGRSVLEVFPGVAEFGLFMVFQRVAKTGIPESHPVSLYRDDRISGWRENYVYRLPSGEVVALYEDVTEKKQAEDAERETRRKYAELFELGSEAIFLIDNETGAILEANAAACEMYGYSRDLLLTMKNIDLSAEQEETRKVTAGTAQGTILVPLRYHRRNDGTVFPVEILGRFFTWNQRPVHIAAIRDITSRLQAEETLRESEERYLSLFNRSLDCIYIHDLKGNFIDANASALELLGYSRDEIPSVSFQDLLGPDDLEKAKAAVETISREGSHSGLIEYRLKRKDGSFAEIETKGTLIVHDGKPSAVFGIARDITSRKRADEMRKAYETRLESAMEIGSLAWWEMDLPEGSVRFDARKATLLGYLPAEFRHYTDFTALLHPDDYAPVMLAMNNHLEGKEARYHADYRVRTSGGDYRWFRDVGGVTSRHPDGSPATVTGIVIDITSGKRAEEALQQSQERYHLLADNINDVLWVLNLETGTWTYMSPSVEWLRGYTAEEVLVQSVEDVMTPASFAHSQKVMPERVERFLQDESGPNSYLDEIEQTCRDGSTVWTEVATRYIRNELGEITLLGLTRDISPRKQAARALEESETRFRSLIQNSSDIIRILGSDGRILYESPSSERILGYPSGSLLGKDPMEFVHPDDVGRVKNDFGEVVDRKNPGIPTEFRIRKADGEYLWVDSIGTNLMDVPGVNGIVITTRPIQQRKIAEERITITIAQLERSEALLRNVYDILPIGLWLADKTGKLVYGNPAGVKIWGAELLVPVEEYGIFRARRYPSGKEIAGDDWALAHSIREGVTIKDEILEIDAFDGKKKVIVNYMAPLYDAAGEIDGAIVVNQEITDKIKAEEALRDNQVRLATAMDIAGLVNWEYDVRSGMFTFDDRFYALYETTAEREGGNQMSAETYLREFVYPEDRQNVLSVIEKLLATTDPGYSGQMEHRITPRDGSVRTIIARFAPVMGPDGTAIRTYGANQDITDSKLMESEIRSLNTVLEQRVKDRTEALVETNAKLEKENAQRLEAEGKLQASFNEKVMLLKEIHHRVKNNLQIIASLLNLQSRYISDPQTLAAIRESQNRVKAMALVHEKLYRSEDISHISLYDYIRFLGTGLFQFYDAKIRGIQFTLEIADVNVDIDSAIPLGLILNELISNSLKYAFPEGRKGIVAISVKKEAHTLTVLYRDNGIGIPADLDWRDTPSLGLRLVNTLVDQMNGTVELDRSAGTLFTMVLHEKEHREEI